MPHPRGICCCCCSVAQSCPTLCGPMDGSTPGLTVHHQLPELAQTRVHWVSDAIRYLSLCHSLLLLPSIFPSIRVFSNDSVFCIRWPSIGVSASASVLPMNTQDWFPLGWTGWISFQSMGLSRIFSNTTVVVNSSVLSFLHSPTLTSIHDYWKNHSLD